MKPARSLNILLVEDGLANQRLAVALLTKWGHQVAVAENGQQALDLVMKNRDYDLILMDLQMPIMDGLEATRAIRQAEHEWRIRIPIVAMTARNLPDDRQQCQAAGMDGFLSKPVRQQEFQAAIDKCMSSQPAHTNPGAGIETDAVVEQTLIDWTVAMDNFDHDLEILLSVLDASLEELPDLARQIDVKLSSGDVTDVRRLAHTIKASARAFCSDQLKELAFELEQAAAALDHQQSLSAFAVLKPLIERFVQELHQKRLEGR